MRITDSGRKTLRRMLIRSRRFGVNGVLEELVDMFDSEWPEASLRGQKNLSVWLRVRDFSRSTWWSFAQILHDEDVILLRIHPWTEGRTDTDKFIELMNKISYKEDYHSNLAPGVSANFASVDFLLTSDIWSEHKVELANLIGDMYDEHYRDGGIRID